MPETSITETPDIARLPAAFIAALRRAGLTVPVGATVAFVEALGATGMLDATRIYWVGRATLIHRPEDRDLYDAAFAAFWLRPPPSGFGAAEEEAEEITLAIDDPEDLPDSDGDGGDEEEDEGDLITVRYSTHEVLQQKDFAEYTDEELDEAYELMTRLKLGGEMRRARRHQPVRKDRGRPDLRRTVQYALRHEGEPIRRAHTEPRSRPRRLVLLLDISGSMESYARALLRFVHAAVVGRRKVEVFTMGTQLTRVTRELQSRDPDAALAKAGEAVQDWSGGTRLGDSIRDFNDQWGCRGMARGAIVVVLSDGWDRGEPEIMDEQMARMHRVAHKVIWVNPLKASPGYAPLAQGMAAALPHLDVFIEGHNLDSVEELARVVSR